MIMSLKTKIFMKKFHGIFKETNQKLFPLLKDLFSYAHYLKHSIRRET